MLSPACSPCLFFRVSSLLLPNSLPCHLLIWRKDPCKAGRASVQPIPAKDSPHHIPRTFCIQALPRDTTSSSRGPAARSGSLACPTRAPPGTDSCSAGLSEIWECTAPGCTGSTLLGCVCVPGARTFLLWALLPGQGPSLASVWGGALSGMLTTKKPELGASHSQGQSSSAEYQTACMKQGFASVTPGLGLWEQV